MRTYLPDSDRLKLGDLAEELVAEFDLGGVHGFKALETEGFDILADELAAIDDGFFSRSNVTSPIKLRATGMEAAESPSSVIQGLTIPPGLRDRVQGCLIPEDSILVLDGDICLENVNVDARAALVAHAAPSASVTIKEAPSPPSPPLRFRNSATPISPNAPEYLRIRGSGSSSRRGNSIPLRLEATGCWRPLLSAFIFETSQQAHLLPCRMSP